MENNPGEDSKSSSSEENDRSGQSDDHTGTGRFYECMFCKRGFTTAQALGGHMNIHRKDRIKSKPNSLPSNSTRAEENYANLRTDQVTIPSYSSHYYSMFPDVHGNYQTTCFQSSSWGSSVRPPGSPNKDDLYAQSPQLWDPYRGEWNRSLGLQIGPSHQNENEEQVDGNDEEEDELDLELRLGHDR